MSPPEIWGPQVWNFIHTLSENINENDFNKIKHGLFSIIKRICLFLPCPDCSNHANHFLMRVDITKIRNKSEFKHMLYVFHNTVNKRKNKPLFHPKILEKYKYDTIPNAFDKFVDVYNTKGNLNLIMESFQRTLVVKDLTLWLYNNHQFLKNKPILESKPIIKHDNNSNNNSNNHTTELLINIETPCDVLPETTHDIISQPKIIDKSSEEFIYEI